MPKPLIGLPGRRKVGADIVGVHEILHGIDLDMYFADYSRGILEAGGLPVNLPVDCDPAAMAERLDGFLLTGGTDIDPARYGAEPHPELLPIETRRDELELELFTEAVERNVPVLGICRGIQIVNVQRGGSLHQHVEPHARFDQPAHTEVHGVSFTPGSTLHDLYGEQHRVNSLHHQAVDRIGEGLVVSARADDGCVEGLELGETVVAVQWHPEMMKGRSTDPIFQWLVDQASKRLANE